jgi:hypothetical protein
MSLRGLQRHGAEIQVVARYYRPWAARRFKGYDRLSLRRAYTSTQPSAVESDAFVNLYCGKGHVDRRR